MVTNKDVKAIPFHWTHPYHMDLRPFDRALFHNLPDFGRRLRAYAAENTGRTLLHKGQMACSWGAISLWPGVAEFWLITAYQFERIPITATRTAIRYFNQVELEMKLHRLQIVVDMKNEVAMRWAAALKFKPEGRLYSYGPDGSDHMMFARTLNERIIQNTKDAGP